MANPFKCNIKYRIHDSQENRQCQNTVSQEFIHFFRGGSTYVAGGYGISHHRVNQRITSLDDFFVLLVFTFAAGLNFLHLGDMCLYTVAGLVICHYRAGEDIEQFLCALAAAAYGLYYRHTERIFHLAAVHLDAPTLCIVLHVKVNEKGNSLF